MKENNDLLDFISNDVIIYMKQNNIQFTDFEKAALIYNSGLPVEEMHSRLERLMKSTDDKTLQEQMFGLLAMEREKFTAFHEHTKGYVYAVKSYEDEYEPYVCGYFANAELAYAHGMKLQCKFKIEKSRIVGLDGIQIKMNKGYLNPYMFSDMDKSELVEEYEGDGVEACLIYDKDGVLLYYSSCEIEQSDEKELELRFNPHRFENVFLSRMPNPFDRGDIVRDIKTGEHGIVELSQDEWKDFLTRVEAGLYVDFSDACITVEFIYENGTISHGHISPIFLEHYKPGKEDDDYDLLLAASGICKGEGSLDWFTHCYDAYKRKCQNV